MKKILTMLLSLCCMAAFACSSGETDGVTGATQKTEDNAGTATAGKSLVVYFSRAGENWQVGVVERGNTAIMVDYIKDLADVDVFEIVPEVAYPEGYEDCKTVATAEVNNNARPAIKTDCGDLSDYDNVFIGGPIWWARPPMIFRTFFEAHPELDGKTLIPFGTHGGSGISTYRTLIQEYYPNATILESLGINGASVRNASARNEVEAWLKKIGLNKTGQDMNNKLYLTIDGQTMTAILVDNAATKALLEALAENAITYEADDYGGFEKVGALGRSLPTSNEQITTQAGDIILYSGNQIVLFYGSNSWSYTRLGRMEYESIDQLKAFLKAGQGNVQVTLSRGIPSAVNTVRTDRQASSKAYTLSGRKATPSDKGFVVMDGKKQVYL